MLVFLGVYFLALYGALLAHYEIELALGETELEFRDWLFIRFPRGDPYALALGLNAAVLWSGVFARLVTFGECNVIESRKEKPNDISLDETRAF